MVEPHDHQTPEEEEFNEVVPVLLIDHGLCPADHHAIKYARVDVIIVGYQDVQSQGIAVGGEKEDPGEDTWL
jgi:hypothetical protein